jgi:CheY-like chemotaxis protein
VHLTELHVVLVDDEPDVHEVSRLAMRQFRVYGLPIRLHSAMSKAQGIDLFHSLTLGRPDISLASVALIDVVMETDHAGLELCEYVRDVMKNRTMQICVRTGQPGIAPERAVLDRYDIQGYLSKAEATEDKLYTVVKAGMRTSYYIGLSHALQDLLHYLTPAASSRQRIADSLRAWQALARQDPKGGKAASISASLCYFAEGRFVAGVQDWADGDAAQRRLEEMVSLPAVRLNDAGDSYAIDGRDLMVQIAATDVNAQVQYMLQGTVPPPDWEVHLYHRYLRTFSALWKQAG